jgi:hypothetical protein
MGEDINPQQALWQIPPTTIASLKHHHGLRAGGYNQPHRRPTALHLPLPNPLVRFKGASGIDTPQCSGMALAPSYGAFRDRRHEIKLIQITNTSIASIEGL